MPLGKLAGLVHPLRAIPYRMPAPEMSLTVRAMEGVMRAQKISAPKQAVEPSMPRSITGARAIRSGLSGAMTMALIFIAAWAAAQLPYGPTPLFIEIFTYAPPATTDALLEGTLVSALAGFIAAGVLAVVYGAFEFIERLGPWS